MPQVLNVCNFLACTMYILKIHFLFTSQDFVCIHAALFKSQSKLNVLIMICNYCFQKVVAHSVSTSKFESKILYGSDIIQIKCQIVSE